MMLLTSRDAAYEPGAMYVESSTMVGPCSIVAGAMQPVSGHYIIPRAKFTDNSRDLREMLTATQYMTEGRRRHVASHDNRPESVRVLCTRLSMQPVARHHPTLKAGLRL
jgi:hypothetical protein